MVVEITPFFERDELKRVLKVIQDAHGQIPAGSAGVLHIEIPHKNSARLLEVADGVFQRVFGVLKSRTRMRAVALSARTFDLKVKEGGDPIIQYVSIVPNGNKNIVLPKEFFVLGFDERGPPLRVPTWSQRLADFFFWLLLWIRGEWPHFPVKRPGKSDFDMLLEGGVGTMFIEFGIYEPLSDQIGRSLFYYCSRDGRRQLRLWQSFKDHFRADVVDTLFGRRVFRANLNDLEVNRQHRLAISWSDQSLSIAVDGRVLEEIKDE